MSTNAFNPQGNTVTFTAATSAAPAVQAVPFGAQTSSYRIVNAGAQLVFLGVGQTAAQAIANATATGAGLPLLPGTDEIIIWYPGAFFTGITTTGSGSVYITPGEGM